MKPSILLVVSVMLALVAVGFSQPKPGIARLELGTSSDPAVSRVSVPFGDEVRISAPVGWPHPIQWTKNGQPIPGATVSPLVLNSVTKGDNGGYTLLGDFGGPWGAGALELEIKASGVITNFSSRMTLPAGNQSLICGFVVEGKLPKRLLIRAVGPSLDKFGITNGVAQPRIKFYNSNGMEIHLPPYPYPVAYPSEYWDAIFAQVGAFPLNGGETSYDAGSFDPGAYTVIVSDELKAGGEVLVEIYEYQSEPSI